MYIKQLDCRADMDSREAELPPIKKRLYRQYLVDPKIPVPITTQWRMNKQSIVPPQPDSPIRYVYIIY